MLSNMATDVTARTRLTGAARREQILDVTHAIVDSEGFHAATPGRIAEEAGVTRPVLYQQFGDLAGVFVALIDRERARAGVQFAEATSRPTSDEQNPFISAFIGILRAIHEHPATWRLFLVPPQGAPPELHERLAQSQAVVRDFLRAELEKAFPGMPDPEYTARMVQASGGELLRLRLTDPKEATVERLTAQVRQIAAVVDR